MTPSGIIILPLKKVEWFLHFDFVEMLRRSAKTESELSSQLSLLLHFCKFAFLHLHFDKMGKAENGRRNSNYHYKANFRGGMLSVKDKITIFASDIRRKL